MFIRIYSFLRQFRKKISRSELAVRWLGLKIEPGISTEPGLVMLQIDGLSMDQLQKGFNQKQLPFLKSLLEAHKFTVKPFYPGQPATTPAVQAELFFGVKTAVPAFEFIDRQQDNRMVMYWQECARKIAEKLNQTGGPALLAGGRSYANFYTAGAEEARYCIESMRLDSLWKAAGTIKFALLAMLHLIKLIRFLGVTFLELILAAKDFFQGVLAGKNLFKELKFIPTRVFICIALRELIRFRVKMDVAQGVPVIHANFMGYDEQSHRRGPDSAFAHWTLKGIDGVIQDIYRTALRSDRRSYRLIVYSDHGQEATRSYEAEKGISVEQAIRTAYSEMAPHTDASDRSPSKPGFDYPYERAKRFLARPSTLPAQPPSLPRGFSAKRVKITTMGPLGHIYLPAKISDPDRLAFARHLVKSAGLPLVLFYQPTEQRVTAVNAHGTHDLQENADRLLGDDHPFWAETARDLAALCRHENAGDLVFSGWSPEQPPLTFSLESGSHGGPGRSETRGFVFLPLMTNPTRPFLRPADLRKTAFSLLRPQYKSYQPPISRQTDPNLNVLTYNIHSCINLNGKADPIKIAEVIDGFSADMVALQEVDSHKPRTRQVPQAEFLADYLNMEYSFFPVVCAGPEKYGLAVLSRYPVVEMKQALLPAPGLRPEAEPRGAMLARIETPQGPVSFLNTHLGLNAKERSLQIQALLGKSWVGDLAPSEPVIFCGDFNAGVRSPVYRRICRQYQDIQTLKQQPGYPRATFFSLYPAFRIDHIFISGHFHPVSVEVPRDRTTPMVSDHLPLYARLARTNH